MASAKQSLVALFHRSSSASSSRSPELPPPSSRQKTTYTIDGRVGSALNTTVTCTSSSTAPSYHIPSPLTTGLGFITLSSTTSAAAAGSGLPRYREVFKLQKLPFIGYRLTSPSGRACVQVHLNTGSRNKADVFLLVPVAGLAKPAAPAAAAVAAAAAAAAGGGLWEWGDGADGGGGKPALWLRKDSIVDARTGSELARMFRYKTGADTLIRALELAGGVGDDERRRDVVVALWLVYLWNMGQGGALALGRF